jgi:hypothetical protein
MLITGIITFFIGHVNITLGVLSLIVNLLSGILQKDLLGLRIDIEAPLLQLLGSVHVGVDGRELVQVLGRSDLPRGGVLLLLFNDYC